MHQVLEETGFDIGPLLKKSDYIELTMREQRIRLYIIQGVPEDTQFTPRTRKEISVRLSPPLLNIHLSSCTISKYLGSN